MLEEILENHRLVFAEFAIAERLRRFPEIELHPTVFNSPLIYGPEESKKQMTALYREYIQASTKAGYPFLLTAPTWRLDAERVREAKVPTTINTDAVNYLMGVRDFSPDSERILVGALVGPKNDCYRPDLSLNSEESREFHTRQINELGESDADFILAQTIPSVSEGLGIAQAIAENSKPYIISFCVGPNGSILDGTRLDQAAQIIDESVARKPVGYAISCSHPSFLLNNYSEGDLRRLVAIQANGSSKDVTKLDGSGKTESDPVDSWSNAMLDAHRRFGIPILGGCCGTSLGHLNSLVQLCQ